MQPVALRAAASRRRLKRRRLHLHDADRAAPPPAFRPSPGGGDDDDDDEDGDADERAPVRRRAVTVVGCADEPREASPPQHTPDRRPDAEPHHRAPAESQIARLMRRRRARADHAPPDDDGAQFRADVARCADDADLSSYRAVPVECFGQQMLAAMGWRPPPSAGDGGGAHEPPVPRAPRLGLGAKLGGGGGGGAEETPPTHARGRGNAGGREDEGVRGEWRRAQGRRRRAEQ